MKFSARKRTNVKRENTKFPLFFLSSIFYLVFSTSIFAQITNPLHFSEQYGWASNKESFLIGLPDDTMLMLWNEGGNQCIFSAKSNDGGYFWSGAGLINCYSQNSTDLNAIVLNSGRILLTYKNFDYRATYSDDNGENWEGFNSLPTAPALHRNLVAFTSLSKLSDGTTVFVYSYSPYPDSIPYKGIYVIRSSDGINWSEIQIIDSSGSNGNIYSIDTTKDILVYETTEGFNKDIVFRTSTDGGYTWSDEQILLSDGYDKLKPRIIKDNMDKFWLLYYRKDPTVFQGYTQNEIYYIASTDKGVTWAQPEKFSDYAGEDELSSLSTWNGLPIVSFGSTRDQNFQNGFYQVYYGIPVESIDISTPPFLYDFSIIPQQPEENETITIRALADDENSISLVNVIIDVNGIIDSLGMFDDGMHNDSLPGDNIYGVVLENGFPNGTLLVYDFLLKDTDNNYAGFKGSYIAIPNFTYYNIYHIEANRLKLPLNNSGVLADVEDSLRGLRFDESSVLFSGGFYLSGYHQNQIWTNAVASASLIEDYLPGPVGSEPDPRNSLYVINSTEPPFSPSWNSYRNAVDRGADFYDGDGDEMYNPVDLNGNGMWDSNEDRPDFLGDVTAWCVFNDGVPSNQRRFNQVNPMGIEIQQTLFAIGDESNPVDNMIFIRYRIINKGTVSAQFDSVYFGIWDDPDLGDGSPANADDLTGCETSLDIGYAYNDGDDIVYGINPPAFGAQLLLGPVVYISGETFIDVNGNGIYDAGVDTPLDTAKVNKGAILGTEFYPGAKNLGATSFIHYMNGEPTMNDPNDHLQARNYMLGRDMNGEIINPCTWQYGYVYDIPCDQVNPLFLYSGDPTIPTGWVNTYITDQRILTNTGPFTLKQDEKIDIWTAYIVGRGSNALESVTKMKEYSLGAKSYYESNFTELPSGVEDDKGINTPVNYSLFQNYPNPFNPTTIISYQLPVSTKVTLKVFDILGREVATLINEEKPVGKYEVEFNANNLSSGVYFYQLKTGAFVQTKKMLLLK